jgi:hypothetical protein
MEIWKMKKHMAKLFCLVTVLVLLTGHLASRAEADGEYYLSVGDGGQSPMVYMNGPAGGWPLPNESTGESSGLFWVEFIHNGREGGLEPGIHFFDENWKPLWTLPLREEEEGGFDELSISKVLVAPDREHFFVIKWKSGVTFADLYEYGNARRRASFRLIQRNAAWLDSYNFVFNYVEDGEPRFIAERTGISAGSEETWTETFWRTSVAVCDADGTLTRLLAATETKDYDIDDVDFDKKQILATDTPEKKQHDWVDSKKHSDKKLTVPFPKPATTVKPAASASKPDAKPGKTYSLELCAEDADLSEAPDVIVEGRPSNLGGWHGENTVIFHVNLEKTGAYRVILVYSKDESVGDPARLRITARNEDSDSSGSGYFNIPATGNDWSNYVERELGTFNRLEAGRTVLRLESGEPKRGGYVMNLRSIKLTPADE